MRDKLKYAIYITYILIMFFLVLGGLILQDYANKPFWWNFWTYSPILGVAGLVYGFFVLPKQFLPRMGDKEK